MMRVKTHRHVWLYSGLITALSMGAPMSVMGLATHRFPWHVKAYVLGMTGLIAFLIALPISVFALNLVRLLTRTIDQVDQLVKFDPLTGVMSRTFFMQAARDRLKDGGCVMIVDADLFKRINDTHGHDVGDEALRTVATALMQAIGSHGLVGRLGGEEFAVCLPAATADEAAWSAERVLESVRVLGRTYRQLPLNLTVSVGVQLVPAGYPLEAAMKGADLLLYAAKRGGRDRFCMSGMEPVADAARDAA